MSGSIPTAERSRPLSDREIDELDHALDALPVDREPFDVAMLDGYLAGVLVLPRVIAPSEWLPPIFDAPDGEPLIPGDEAKASRTLDLVMRHYHTLEAHIRGREPFDPILYDVATDDGAPASREQAFAALWPWAAGFTEAMQAFPDLLDLADDDEDLDDALAEIHRHVPIDPDDTSDAARESREWVEAIDAKRPLTDVDDAVAAVVDAVLDIADITRPREPIVREQPKVGRNDPCPCGSGRKFKQCHGQSG
ncbi:MAG: UPF0149 family protein [Burkholderiales bacterium]